MKNNQKGITLIALVITIIVLLILAGISIAMLTGENGILSRAKSAGTESKIADAKEQVSLTINDLISEFYEEKYVNTSSNVTAASAEAYVAEKLTAAKIGTEYVKTVAKDNDTTPTTLTITLADSIKDASGNPVVGEYTLSTGAMTWSDKTTSTNTTD